jgi:hypothetical protein
MLVPVLRGRTAVTLSHDTSLLGPDGVIHLRSRRDHVTPQGCPDVVVVKLAVPLTTSIRYGDAVVTVKPARRGAAYRSAVTLFGRFQAVIRAVSPQAG